MLGTDYPFPLGELSPGSLIESMDELGSLKVIFLKMFNIFQTNTSSSLFLFNRKNCYTKTP